MSFSELPEKPELEVPVKVYFYDTDAGGVIHNVAYLRMIEMARSDLAEYLGWPLSKMMEPGQTCPVVARTEIDYVKPARMGDDLVIRGKLTSMEKIRFHLEFEMIRRSHSEGASKEEVICRCQQTMVPVTLASGRPQRMRKEWLEKWPDLDQGR